MKAAGRNRGGERATVAGAFEVFSAAPAQQRRFRHEPGDVGHLRGQQPADGVPRRGRHEGTAAAAVQRQPAVGEQNSL